MAPLKNSISFLVLALTLSSFLTGLSARSLLQATPATPPLIQPPIPRVSLPPLPAQPPVPAQPTLPRPTGLPSLPSTQIPSLPNPTLPTIPNLPTVTLPPFFSIPTTIPSNIPFTMPSIPFLSPPPSK